MGPCFATLKMYSVERVQLRGIFVREISETTKRVKLFFNCFVLYTFVKNSTTEN